MIGLIESGECTLTIDSEPHRFEAGEAFFILPGQTHGFAGATDLKACILMVDTASQVTRTDAHSTPALREDTR